jgi:hypothetical protein
MKVVRHAPLIKKVPNIVCVYALHFINDPLETKYYGSTKNLKSRLMGHISILARGDQNSLFQTACGIFGIQNLTYEIIEQYESGTKPEIYRSREILEIKANKNCFNIINSDKKWTVLPKRFKVYKSYRYTDRLFLKTGDQKCSKES